KMLKKIGIAAEIVDNGQLALQQLKTNEYDLVIMDCQMPVMDGYEATQGIRKLNHKNANIPVIALTANTCMEIGRKASNPEWMIIWQNR
ncbi:MAG: response regulator, partial [Gammaproteobacteria bacterium]|nr:response regulator [Gammaproteobacteria bacterium]